MMAMVGAALTLHMACADSQAKMGIELTAASGEPQLFAPGIVSTQISERDMTISADGSELYYTAGTPDNAYRTILHIKRTSDGWGSPEIASFSGVHMDIEATFAPNGDRLFFASKRPLHDKDSTSDYNLWFVERTDDSWGEPKALPESINTDGDEYFPSVATNGNLYFTSCREDCKGIEDIYFSEYVDGKYLTPISLDSNINTNTYEFNAFVAPDESYLIFGSWGRPDGFGGGDLYVSYRNADKSWSRAVNMGEGINSEGLDFCPFVDVHRNTLYFTSGRALETDTIKSADHLFKMATAIENGLTNIYSVLWRPERTDG